MKWEGILKRKLKAIENKKYHVYVQFIKKVLKDEGGAVGMQGFIDAGQEYEGFDKKYLEYVISDILDHKDWMEQHEEGDYILKSKPNRYFINKVIEDFENKLSMIQKRVKVLTDKLDIETITDKEDKELSQLENQIRILEKEKEEFINKNTGTASISTKSGRKGRDKSKGSKRREEEKARKERLRNLRRRR